MQDISKIYKAERKAEEQAQEQAEAELIRLRQERVVPLLVALDDKIKKSIPEVPPLTTLGKALLYAAKVLPQVRNYAGSVYLTLDNNPIENKVRPFALGRKNWLFSNTPEGADALATWYSLLETAKANGWNPQTYLLHLMEGLRLSAPQESLLPTNFPPTD